MQLILHLHLKMALSLEAKNGSVFKKYSWMGIETQGGMHFSEITGGVGEAMRIGTDVTGSYRCINHGC